MLRRTRAASEGEMKSTVRRATIQAAGIAVAVTAAFFALSVVNGPLVGLDLSRYDLGLLCAIREAWRFPGPPWLSPSLGLGSPLFADPGVALLYPPRWLSMLPSTDWGGTLYVLAHLVAGAGTTTWLARSFGVRPSVAACAGVAFALTGPIVDLRWHGTYVIGATWLPFAWAAARAACSSAGHGGGLALAVALAALLLGGEPQAFAIACGVALLELALHRGRGWHFVVVAIVLGALVGSAQTWVTLGETALSGRGQGFTLARILEKSFDATQWSGLVLRRTSSMSHDAPLIDLTVPRPGGVNPSWNIAPYVGLGLLAAAVVGAARRRFRAPVVVAIGAFAIATGPTLGVLPLLVRVLPPVGSFRYPAKYLVIATLACVLLAASGWDAATRSRVFARRLLVAASVVAVPLFAFVVCADLVEEHLRGEGLLRVAYPPHVMRGQAVAAFAPMLGVVVTLLLALRTARPLLLLVPPACAVVDLALFASHTLSAGPPIVDVEPVLSPVTDSPLREPAVCVDARLSQLALAGEGIDPIWGWAALTQTVGGADLNCCNGIPSGVAYTPLQSHLNWALEYAFSRGEPEAMRALGCERALLFTPTARPGFEPRDDDRVERLSAYVGHSIELGVVVDPFPLAFAVPSPRLCPDEKCFLAALLGGQSVRAIVDDPTHALGDVPLPPSSDTTVALVERGAPHSAVLDVKALSGGVVGLRTLYLLGWRAELEGKPLPVVRVAGNLLGVVVPPNTEGRVHLRYEPPHLWQAVAAGVLGLLGLLAYGLAPRIRRRLTHARPRDALLR